MLCAPVPPRRSHPGEAGPLRLTPGQLRINQRISQAAVRRAAAIERWLDEGVVAGDLCGGAIGPADLGPGVTAVQSAGAAPVAARSAAGGPGGAGSATRRRGCGSASGSC